MYVCNANPKTQKMNKQTKNTVARKKRLAAPTCKFAHQSHSVGVEYKKNQFKEA